MATLEDRLRTRFEWGLLTDIQPPEYETRLAILRHKVRAQGFTDIPDEVLSFIATHITDNVRELEGALVRVAAYASLTRVPATEDIAREVLADNLRTKCSRVITPQVILEETAKMFNWTIEDLCGRSRRRPLVIARQIGMYVFRELTDYSYPKIAEEFGGRDHTTVMHACEKIRGQMAERRVVFEQVNELIMLPVSQSARAMDKGEVEVLVLNMDAEGKVHVVGQQKPLANLGQKISFLRTYYSDAKHTAEERGDKNGDVKTTVIIRGHQQANYAQLYELMGLCKEAKFKKIQLRANIRNVKAGG